MRVNAFLEQVGRHCRTLAQARLTSRRSPERIYGIACSVFVVAAAVLAVASPAGVSVRRFVLGRSVEGRAIVAFEVGDTDSRRRELVVGCIHGDEAAGVAIARKLEHASPPGVDLWVVPVLNPDGLVAGTRGNAHGVDLNRNFPWRWRRLGGVFYSGPRPLSEPESRIAYRLIRRLHPDVSIWFHQHLDVVDRSGGSVAVERRFAVLAGLRLVRLPREPGSVVGWENHNFAGTTGFVVELPAGNLSATAVGRFADATLAVGGRDTLGPG
jgi:murein peptide amidase A